MKRIVVSLLVAMIAITTAVAQKPNQDARKLSMALYAISNLYVDPVDDSKLVEDAITGMLEKLDPHSNYMDPEETKEMTEPLQGNFDGIGIQFNMLTDTLYVIQVIPSGPSEKVGLMAGDRIIMGDDTLMCVCSDHGATPMGPILNTAHALKEAGLCSYEPKKSENYWDIYEETEGFNYVLDVSKSLAVPQRYMFVYVNLKGKYPGGIVEPEDYEKVRGRIIDALLDYKHPETGERPVLLAVRREDAHVFGMGGAQAGDVVYVLKPEYMAEHGYGLPTGESGCGSLKNLLMFRGPNIKKGYRYTRPRWLADIVPTLCYMTGGPVPADAEGAPIYQIMEDPNLVK